MLHDRFLHLPSSYCSAMSCFCCCCYSLGGCEVIAVVIDVAIDPVGIVIVVCALYSNAHLQPLVTLSRRSQAGQSSWVGLKLFICKANTCWFCQIVNDFQRFKFKTVLWTHGTLWWMEWWWSCCAGLLACIHRSVKFIMHFTLRFRRLPAHNSSG